MVIPTLVRRACEQAGLMPLLQARSEHTEPPPERWAELLERADLIAVGALSDYVARTECGNTVRIHVPTPPLPSTSVIVLRDRESLGGTDFLRKIAVLRLLGRPALSIVYDWRALGWDLAPLAIAFGANELSGPVASSMRPSDTGRTAVDRDRIVALVHRANRTPIFVNFDGTISTAGEAASASCMENR